MSFSFQNRESLMFKWVCTDVIRTVFSSHTDARLTLMVLINLNFNVDYLPEVSEFVIINKIPYLSCLYYALQIADIQYTMWCYYLNNRTWVNCELLSLLKIVIMKLDALDGYRLFSQDRCRVQNWNGCFMHLSAKNSPQKLTVCKFLRKLPF